MSQHTNDTQAVNTSPAPRAPEKKSWADIVEEEDQQADAPAEIATEAPTETPIEVAVEVPADAPVNADAEGPTDEEFDRFCDEQPEYPPVVYWYTPVTIPKATALIFSEPDLYALLCDFCRTLQNIEANDSGRVVRTLCESCCAVLGRHPFNACQGVFEGCEGARFVDAVGAVAPLCRACHQHEEKGRRARREGNRHRGGRRARSRQLVV